MEPGQWIDDANQHAGAVGSESAQCRTTNAHCKSLGIDGTISTESRCVQHANHSGSWLDDTVGILTVNRVDRESENVSGFASEPASNF